MPHGVPNIPTGTLTPRPTAAPGSIGVQNGQIVIYNGSQWIPLGNVPEEEPMADFRVSYKAHNVNTKRLLNKLVDEVNTVVSEYVFQRTSTLSKSYDYSQLIEYLTLVLEQMQDEKEITTYNVVGDHRNNDVDDVRRGHIKVVVQFKQFNCLNITTIAFTLERN